MVAEKSDMTFSSGVRSSMNWMSSMNPISSMVSASSSTTCRTSFISMVPRLRWSMSRPGVATSISTPLSSASVCTFMPWPPYMVATRMSVCLPNSRMASVICMASSLVGASTRPCMVRSGFMSWSMETAYAAVLPDPVCAWPTTSLPVSSTGMAASCMGNGSSKPISSIAFSISWLTPSSSNFVILLYSCDDRIPLHAQPSFPKLGNGAGNINACCFLLGDGSQYLLYGELELWVRPGTR